MHIARVGERLPRLQIQFRISRSFRPRNLANLGSKIRFWIRQKEHTLNRALQRENYPMPTIEEVASRLHGAKVFASPDVSNRFWHVVLDEESLFCTKFNTPFGRYC